MKNVGGKLNRDLIAHVQTHVMNAREEWIWSEIDFHVQPEPITKQKVRLPTKVSNSSVLQVLHFVDPHDPVFSSISFLQHI